MRNILLGSLRAAIDEITVNPNLFGGVRWPRSIVPAPEPYEPEQPVRKYCNDVVDVLVSHRLGDLVGEPRSRYTRTRSNRMPAISTPSSGVVASHCTLAAISTCDRILHAPGRTGEDVIGHTVTIKL